MDFELPEELKLLQGAVRRFVQEELAPLERQVEENDDFPETTRRALKQKARELGLWAICAPVAYGGGGLGALARVMVAEELGKVSVAVGYQGGIIGGPRPGYWAFKEFAHATEEQKQEFLVPVVKGAKEPFGAMTEPNADSDIANMETRADRQSDSYVLNGGKIFITAVDSGDFGYVFAVTDWEKRRKGGITCFFVDKHTPGLSWKPIPVMGRRGLHVYELTFTDCAVPAGISWAARPGPGNRLRRA
ncbi:MAG: acyl-CoA dehydrogenase family protein [Chloroflexi bacterium]|nr:acyl-CoA dehydrogenase family protein [Chloroflexota bacterium]